MNILTKLTKAKAGIKIASATTALALVLNMSIGVIPAMALVPGPVIDSFYVAPGNDIVTNGWPMLVAHAVDATYEITGCEYRYQLDNGLWSDWIAGDYITDINDVDNSNIFGAGQCMSYEVDASSATTFSGEIRMTNSQNSFSDTGVITRDVSNIQLQVTVQSVTTDSNTLPVITGTIDDPAAFINVNIYSEDYSVYSGITGVNNGDGTWSAQAVDNLPAGTYILDVTADNFLNMVSIKGSYTVNYIPPVVDTTGPVISIVGNVNETVMVGDNYVDAGATAVDDVNGDVTGEIISTNYVDTTTIGSYIVAYDVTDFAGNPALTVARTVDVIARDVTVKANAVSKVYGSSDPVLSYSITDGSLIQGDNFTGSITRVAGSNVGDYAINQGTLGLSNDYNLTFVSDNLTITKAPISVEADNYTRVVGESNPVFDGLINGIVNGDIISASYTTVADTSSPAGSYVITPTLSGDALGNYEPTIVSGMLTVTEAPVPPVTPPTDPTTPPTDPTTPPTEPTTPDPVESTPTNPTPGTSTTSTPTNTTIVASTNPVVISDAIPVPEIISDDSAVVLGSSTTANEDVKTNEKSSDEKDNNGTSSFAATVLGVYDWVWVLIAVLIVAIGGGWWYMNRNRRI